MEKNVDSLSGIIKERERVLLCLPQSGSHGQSLQKAVADGGGVPVFPGETMRWFELLRCSFDGRFRTVIGAPRVILGLCKLSRYMETPLYVRNAVLTGQCPPWMREAIARSLDCKTWLYAPEEPAENAGNLWEQEDAMLHWSSVLDVRLIRGPYGLELEAVIFPGKQLPAFPNCARQRVGIWNPESDIPFSVVYDTKNWKNH